MEVSQMATFRVRARVEDDGSIRVSGLPLQAGEYVEVVVNHFAEKSEPIDRYPLRGKASGYYYHQPFAGVDVDEWESPE